MQTLLALFVCRIGATFCHAERALVLQLGKWDRAKTLARRGGRDLQDYVEKEHMERLMAEGDSSRIVEVNVEAGLQLLAKQGKVKDTHFPGFVF